MVSYDPNYSHRPSASSSDEQARLDEAMQRADELLFSSLQVDERQRRRRRWILLSLGGIVMVTVVGIILVSLNFAPPASPANRTQAATLTEAGWKLWQQQSFAQAQEKFEAATQLDARNVNAWNGLGWAQFNQGQWEPAAESFREVVKLQPKHPAALNGLGQVAFLQRDYDQAEKHLLKAAPQASAAWYGLAKVYLLQGKYDAATPWLQKIANAGDSDPTVEQMLQAAQEKQLSPELRQLIEPAPQGAGVAEGWQLLNRGQHADARATFEELLAKNPDDADALNGLGWCLLIGGEADEAQPYFERALEQQPLAGGAMNGMARVLSAQGDVDGAMRIWQEMVEKIPGVHAGTVGLANAHMQRSEYAEAIPLLEQLTASDPKNEQYQSMLRRAREEQ